MRRKPSHRSIIAALAGAVLLAGAEPSAGDLAARRAALRAGIAADSAHVRSYAGRLHDLEARLAAIRSSLAIQQGLLDRLRGRLRSERRHLVAARLALVADRHVLVGQLVAQYESPPPDLIDVVTRATSFSDLLERVDDMRRIAHHNATRVTQVNAERGAYQRETVRLAAAEAQQQRVTASVSVERDQIAQLHVAVLRRQLTFAHARARKTAELHAVERRLSALQARAAAAQRDAFGGSVPAGIGFGGGGFSSHGGNWGFFPAAGTNYSVGREPAIAARLDALGRALHLHLIGISGYRSPQHSVEVGGFANDPHTRGEASDTPGVEGVPESTLRRFGLTRPFAGAAEADHIQLA